MTKSKRITLICIGIALLLLISYIIYEETQTPDYPLYTTHSNAYDGQAGLLFPDEIPSEAQIVSYKYYNYWEEAVDVYLELQFTDADALQSYVRSFVAQTVEELNRENEQKKPFGEQWFIEEQNPYNNAYTDLIFARNITATGAKSYTGFSVEPDENDMLYKCSFSIISYSIDDLTVIHTESHGWFRNIHRYIPQWLLRFGVPISTEHERRFYIYEYEE